MKKILCLFGALMLAALMCSCTKIIEAQPIGNGGLPSIPSATEMNNSNFQQGSDDTLNNNPINGFDTLHTAPPASGSHETSDISKILFYETYNQEVHNAIAVDIGSKMLYTNPDINFLDLDEPDYQMSEEDVQIVLDILQKYNVMAWDELYTEEAEYEDGYSWIMYIQYADGTVNSFAGRGPSKNSVVPEKFDAFVDEMMEFIKTRK